jgi:ribosomal protein S18 acetylase RimI-like enzyme
MAASPSGRRSIGRYVRCADTGSMDPTETARRLATVAGLVAGLGGRGAPPRTHAVVAGIDVVDLGVPTPWSVRAHVPVPAPTAALLGEAVAWCRSRGGDRGFRTSVPAVEQGQIARFGLVAVETLGVYAMPASRAGALDPVEVDGLEISEARDVTELVTAYGGWMTDLPLAEKLVCAADLVNPFRRFLVGRVDGRAVGCALVWFAARTAYLSGIGILPDARRRGYGRALTNAAVRVGVSGGALDARPDLIWMHATTDGAALYSAMGFEHVDDHLHFGPTLTA